MVKPSRVGQQLCFKTCFRRPFYHFYTMAHRKKALVASDKFEETIGYCA